MSEHSYSSFAGNRLISSSDLRTVLVATKARMTESPDETILIFNDETGRQEDFDFRGTPDEVVERAIPAIPKTGPGRPKLGVTSAEVSLLPRHWEWLEQQPKSISATLRDLVEAARKNTSSDTAIRKKLDAAAAFMWTMAGNLPQFEEASRALYAKDSARLQDLTTDWPTDIRNHLFQLSGLI